MAEIVRMPLMSDTMTEGVIVEWHKEVGDAIESGDLLAEIETDKAVMEFEAPEDGKYALIAACAAGAHGHAMILKRYEA